VSNAVAVALGGSHALALLGDGSLAFWGDDTYGQFGTAKTGTVTVLASPPGGAPTRIVAGRDFTCYIAADTDVYCAGRNDMSQLGIGYPSGPVGTFQQLLIPETTALSAGGVPAAGDAGAGSACAISGGFVLCWGDNTYGQIGDGSMVGAPFPVNVGLAHIPQAG